MLTDDQPEGIVEALIEDAKDLPPCQHAACTVLHVIFGPRPDDGDPHDFKETSMHFLGWLELGMTEVIAHFSDPAIQTYDEAEAVVKSELAVWFAKGVMMGKKLARVDDVP